MKRFSLLLLCTFFAAIVPASAQVVVEEIVARVNDQVITRSDYQRNKDQLMKDLREQGTANLLDEYKKREQDVLRDLVDQQLLVQRGKTMGMNVEGDLIKRLDEYRKQMNLPDIESLESEAQKQGVSFEDFKNNLRNSILTQQVIGSEVGRKMNLNPSDVQKYYSEHKKDYDMPEAVHIAEILIGTDAPAGSTLAAPSVAKQEEDARIAAGLEKAKSIAEQVRKGSDFAALAKKESSGPTAADGGDLGGFKRGQLDKIFEEKVFNMKAGQVSEPIRTRQGWVLLKLIEKQEAGVQPLKQVEVQIQEALYYENLRPALRVYLTHLREDAFINIKEGYVDSGSSPNQTTFVYTTKEQNDAKKKTAKKHKRLGIF